MMMTLWLSLALAGSEPVLANAPSSPLLRLTAGSGVRVRARPEAAAPEVTRLPIGAVLQVLRVTAAPVVVGAQKDVWYEVATDKGPGWVFAPLTVPLDPASPDEAWLSVARARLPLLGPMTGPEEADLARVLRRVMWAGHTELARAELASAMVQALAAAAQDTTDCGIAAEGPLCKELLRLFPGDLDVDGTGNSGQLHLTDLLYDQVGGLAMGTPFEEPVAWLKAQYSPVDEVVDLPGVLYFVSDGEASYLRLLPDGPHAGEALEGIKHSLDPMFADQTEWTPELRAEVGADLAALRRVVETSHHASRAGVLAAIDALGPRVQAPPPTPVKVRAPVEVVRGAYDDDLPDPPLARALDVALHHAVCWDGMGYPSFDYATGSQDPNPQGVAMRELPRSGGVMVDVSFMNWQAPTVIHWDLVEEAGEWRVANVRGKSGDMEFDLLEGARSQVGSPCGERPED